MIESMESKMVEYWSTPNPNPTQLATPNRYPTMFNQQGQTPCTDMKESCDPPPLTTDTFTGNEPRSYQMTEYKTETGCYPPPTDTDYRGQLLPADNKLAVLDDPGTASNINHSYTSINYAPNNHNYYNVNSGVAPETSGGRQAAVPMSTEYYQPEYRAVENQGPANNPCENRMSDGRATMAAPLAPAAPPAPAAPAPSYYQNYNTDYYMNPVEPLPVNYNQRHEYGNNHGYSYPTSSFSQMHISYPPPCNPLGMQPASSTSFDRCADQVNGHRMDQAMARAPCGQYEQQCSHALVKAPNPEQNQMAAAGCSGHPRAAGSSRSGANGCVRRAAGRGATSGGCAIMARRKNASRESTATLKDWLDEHGTNPYPTKGEKIMLSIITKMSLTQVSTWFANARRRLKKENREAASLWAQAAAAQAARQRSSSHAHGQSAASASIRYFIQRHRKQLASSSQASSMLAALGFDTQDTCAGGSGGGGGKSEPGFSCRSLALAARQCQLHERQAGRAPRAGRRLSLARAQVQVARLPPAGSRLDVSESSGSSRECRSLLEAGEVGAGE